MDENKTVPNFGVNLKPDKFHTVAHFKKKKYTQKSVPFPFAKYSVYRKGAEHIPAWFPIAK